MPSLTTFYRAFVMIVTGVIVVQGWQLYGPTNEQLKGFGVKAFEMAQVAWKNMQPHDGAAPPAAADPRLASAPAAMEPPPSPARVVEPAPLFLSQQEALAPAVLEGAEDDSPVEAAVGLPSLYSRLEQLGASDPQLSSWGSSGQMFRFCCRAAVADSPAFARHFEAVAAEPLAAVEKVVAKVEAWRAVQRGAATELR